MIDRLIQEIELEARKRLSRQAQRKKAIKKKMRQYEKRTGLTAKPPVQKAWFAGQDKHFCPRYCIKHSKFIAKGIWNSLLNHSYTPKAALRLEIPKPRGGTRPIFIFSIPDAAVARVISKKAIEKNDVSFSGSSFAYRPSRSPLDAIMKIRNLTRNDEAFLIKFDFKSFFDSIPHEHLRKLIGKGQTYFIMSELERSVIHNFMVHEYVSHYSHQAKQAASALVSTKRDQGVPQGATLSTFLANVAAHLLDLELDKMNGAYVRYADDLIILTQSYDDANRAKMAVIDFSHQSGILINHDKSKGIRGFRVNSNSAEISSVNGFDFLGYSISVNSLYVSKVAIARFKRKISSIIYEHLLISPRKGNQNPSRIGPGFIDWDLVTCINAIRRYLYGGLSEKQISDFLNNRSGLPRFFGPMSHFCLIENVDDFSELDGWLVNVLLRAYRFRVLLCTKQSFSISTITRERIIDGTWYDFPKIANETVLPSFVRAWRVSRKLYWSKGLKSITVDPFWYAYQV